MLLVNMTTRVYIWKLYHLVPGCGAPLYYNSSKCFINNLQWSLAAGSTVALCAISPPPLPAQPSRTFITRNLALSATTELPAMQAKDFDAACPLSATKDPKIYNGDFNENVTLKYHFALSKFFRGYSISFTSYNSGEVS